MADDGNNGATIDPKREAEIKKLIDETASATTRPGSPLRAQRERAWQSMAKPQREPSPCASCDQPTLMSLNGQCRECFIANTPVATQTAAPSLSAQQRAVQCVLCARVPPATPEHVDPTVYFQEGESLIRGKGGVVCASCAFSAAGCAGAKDAAEARRMMATTATQAQATRDCDVALRIAEALEAKLLSRATAGETIAEDSLMQLMTLSEAAETFARIARGDR